MTPPSWRYRRILIFGAFGLGVAMIVFAAATYALDTNTGSQLIIAGTSIITLILSSYILAATWEDTSLRKNRDGGDSA